jgi:hypothetical protein
MAVDPNVVEYAVSRTLRDNLVKIQQTAEELHQAVNDLVSACSSSRPSNALPPMLRAQTSAAALSATLEVLSRFVTGALQPGLRVPFEPDMMQVPSMMVTPPAPPVEQHPPIQPAPVHPAPMQPPPPPPHPTQVSSWKAPTPVEPAPKVPGIAPPPVATPIPESAPALEMPLAAEPAPPLEPAHLKDPAPTPMSLPEMAPEVVPVVIAESRLANEPVEAAPIFSLDSLPPEEQELHRRAYRVAKVSMQDIKLLRPEEVRLGRQNKDLCIRLRDEIEKAHKEYARRFQAILSHPVDYFYDWLVEILAGGDPQLLGKYPYPSPVLHK